MKYTEKLNLPIYDTPETDLFKIQDWNNGNTKIEQAYDEMLSYNEAENQRILSEQERFSNEASRISNENTRVLNENTRVQKEEERRIKEEERKQEHISMLNAEALRKTEESNRVASENARIQAENLRVSKEDERKTKETERQSNETLRISKETERQNKEIQRLSAEEERKSNEIARQTVYKEIEDARKDFNGVVRDNLGERLSYDLGYINDRFNDASYLKSEDKHITVKECFDGVTRDLKISGITLQNLSNFSSVNGDNIILDEKGDITLPYNASHLMGAVFSTPLLKQRTKYTVIINITENNLVSKYAPLKIHLGSNSVYADLNINEKGIIKKVLTTDDDLSLNLRVLVRTNDATSGYVKFNKNNVMLLEGDYTNEDLPFFDGIKSFGENSFDLVSCGKNLFDGKFKLGDISSSTGQEGQSSKALISVNYIKIDGTQKYRALFNKARPEVNNITGRMYDLNLNYLGTVGYGGGYLTGLVPEAKYIKIRFLCQDTVSLNDVSNVMIFKDFGVEEPYEPYKGSRIPVTLNAPLRSLPNGVKDELDLENGKVIRRIGKIVLNGSENWVIYNTNVINTFSAKISLPYMNVKPTSDSSITDGIRFIKFTENIWSLDNEGLGITQTAIAVRVDKSKLSSIDIDGFKKWLKSNNITLYYELETPVEEPIDIPNNLRTFDGETNIFIDVPNELDTTISARLPVGTNEIFDARKSEVKNKSFGRLDERFEEIEKELKDTNTDFNKVEHSNLKERLNEDFDNIHQRINESSLLPYEGTNISAENSYYGLVKDLSIRGRTLQNLIKNGFKNWIAGASGSNTVTKEDYKLIVNKPENTTQVAIVFSKSNLPLLKPNTKYTVVATISNNTLDSPFNLVHYYQYTMLTKNACTVDVGFNGIYVGSFTTIDDLSLGDRLEINIGANRTGTVTIENYMILEGNYENTSFSDLPFIEGIKSVGENEVTDDGKYKVKVKSCGKNLFDINNFKVFSNMEDYYLPINTYNNSNEMTYRLKPNAKYTLSIKKYNNEACWIGFVIDDVYKNNGNLDDFKYTFTTNSTGICKLKIGANAPANVGVSKVTYIQLEEGTVGTNYEPYKETVVEYQLDEPLRNLPNGAEDIINQDGVLTKRIGKVVLDGDEGFRFVNTYSSEDYLFFDLANFYSNGVYLLCDRFKVYKVVSSKKEEELCFVDNTWSTLCFKIAKAKLPSADVTGFKAWLSQNPVTVYYELAEPITTQLEKPQLFSQDTITHITSDNLLSPTISCKIPSNVQTIVSELREENENLKILTTEQDKAIDTTLLATDEIYRAISPILNISEISDNNDNNKFIDLYKLMIKRNLIEYKDIPIEYQE